MSCQLCVGQAAGENKSLKKNFNESVQKKSPTGTQPVSVCYDFQYKIKISVNQLKSVIKLIISYTD